MVTFISSVFKPPSVIQKNAIYSWKKAGIPFLLMGSDIPVKTEKYMGFPGDSPIIPDMIRQALPFVMTSQVAIMNSDILIDDFFVSNLLRITDKYGSDIFMTSVRKDIEWDEPIQKDSDLEKSLSSKFTWHSDASADMFLSSKEKFEKLAEEFPEFIYGRLAWDNALHMYFKSLGIPCFNTSNSLRLYHQKHGYEHLSVSDFSAVQRNPGVHPSTNYNCHLFGGFIAKMKMDIPRVRTAFPEPAVEYDVRILGIDT